MIYGLYAITDPNLMPGNILFAKVTAALQGGCRLIQYRNKSDPYSNRLDDATQLRDLCRQYDARLIVNDDLDLALASAADGVHLGQNDVDLADAKQKVADNFILGATCHASLELATSAREKGAHYLAFGRFFSSQTKAHAPSAKPELIAAAKQQFRLPLVAIGGVTVDNAAALIEYGADAVAVCYDLFQHQNPADVRHKAEKFSKLFP
jgi:thiamine-phosphate pyrophosphorylase